MVAAWNSMGSWVAMHKLEPPATDFVSRFFCRAVFRRRRAGAHKQDTRFFPKTREFVKVIQSTAMVQ
jgi:hypothetical protein